MTEQSKGLVDSEKYSDGEPGSMSFDKLDKLVKAFLRKEYKHSAPTDKTGNRVFTRSVLTEAQLR